MRKMNGAVFFAALLAGFCSCTGTVPADSADAAVLNKKLISGAKSGIQSGDVILRSGRDFTSYRIRELSDIDKTYSHAGIAYVQDTNVYIYHITPPELNEPAADTAMRLEPLEKFADPHHCFGFGIVRYQLNENEIQLALHYLDSMYQKKVSFDHSFNLDDHNQLYCSEMVDDALRYASNNRIAMTTKYFTKLQAAKAARYFHRTMADVNKTAYISIDNLQLNPACSSIHNYVFLK